MYTGFLKVRRASSRGLLASELGNVALVTAIAMPLLIGSAGHPPAILIRGDGLIRTTSGGGIPLGLFPDDFEVGVESLELAPGDTLFLYSDGLIECSDAARGRFGQERLVEILAANADKPVTEVPRAVEQALLDFCGGGLRDDVSMLALRVTYDGNDVPRRILPVSTV